MQVGDHRYVGPTASDGVVLGGEVVEVEHVGLPSPGRRERCLPHRGQVIGQRRVDRGQHHIGRVVAFFERRVHRHWCRHRTATRVERRHRRRVVQIVQLDIPEERRRVGVLTRRTERPSHQRHRPAGVAERHGQVAGHLRRATTRKEQQAHHHPATSHERPHYDPQGTTAGPTRRPPPGVRAAGRRRARPPLQPGRGRSLTAAASTQGRPTTPAGSLARARP